MDEFLYGATSTFILNGWELEVYTASALEKKRIQQLSKYYLKLER